MYVLILNDMRAAAIEFQTTVCVSDTIEELQALVARETVEVYQDLRDPNPPGGSWWGKTFRKGGPLEWFNRPDQENLEPGYHGMGAHPWEPLPHVRDL